LLPEHQRSDGSSVGGGEGLHQGQCAEVPHVQPAVRSSSGQVLVVGGEGAGEETAASLVAVLLAVASTAGGALLPGGDVV
jgi:hypothetical protein